MVGAAVRNPAGDEFKADYARDPGGPAGTPRRLGTVSPLGVAFDTLMQPPLKSATREERLRAIDEHGVMGR